MKKFVNSKSLFLRLALFFSFTTILIFLCFGLYIETKAEEHFIELDMAELSLVGEGIEKMTEERIKESEIDALLSIHPNIFAYIESENGEILYVSHKDLELIVRNRDITPTQEAIKTHDHSHSSMHAQAHRSHPQIWNDGENYYRVLISAIPKGNLIVGMDINFHQHYIDNFRMSLWFAAAAACIIMVLTSFFVIYFSLRSIKTISKKIAEITSERLSSRLDPYSVPSELQSLIFSFNKMISNIEDVFERQSNFSADIAHELRTPISSLITQTQIMLNRARSKEEYKEILYSNLEEFERMSKMINDMLFLSKCEKGVWLEDEIDIGIESAKLIDYFGILAEEKNVTLTLSGETFLIKGNRDMIKRALGNLISNAINYAKENSEIKIELSKNETILRISNQTQNALSKENIERLFDRFYRADSARNRKNGGSGIGLAIVKFIIEAHKGSITARYENGLITFGVKFN